MWSPLPYGQTGQDRVTKYVIPPIKLTQNTKLGDLCEDGVWFTAALPLTAFRRPVDPLPDFLARRPDDGVRVFVNNRMRLFSGIGKPGMVHWDYAVFWCPKASWNEIGSHLENCVYQDGHDFTLSGWLPGTMPDAAAWERFCATTWPPRVPVAVLGLRTKTWCHYLDEHADPWQPLFVRKQELSGELSDGDSITLAQIVRR